MEMDLFESRLTRYVDLFFRKLEEKSKRTHKTYFNSLQLMARNLFNTDIDKLSIEDIESLDYEKLENYKYQLKEVNANTTVNNRISAIKTFIEYLSANRIINYNIAELSHVKPLNDDGEITEMIPEQTLYDYVQYFEEHEKRKGLEKKWASILLLETGNRANEVLALTKDQFIKYGEFYIVKSKGSKRGKGNKDYAERVDVELYNELMKLNPESNKVFTISYDMLNSAFNRANEYFGNTDLKYTPHSIKHLAVTLEYRYTRDILSAQRKGKHSSIETTRRYLRLEEALHPGAYSRRINMNEELYVEAENEELVEAITMLPKDIQTMINEQLQKIKENK